ncbi:hypothetical protein JCM21900_001155 [Sporobolomyces salmonicolor]
MSALLFNTAISLYAGLTLPFFFLAVALTSFGVFCGGSRLFHSYPPPTVGVGARPDLYSPEGAHPIFGDLWRITKMCDRHQEQLVEMLVERKKHGVKDPARALTRTIPWNRLVSLTRPEHLEWIQKTNFSQFQKGPDLPWNMGQILGEGIFTTDGHAWSVQRKASSRIFNNHAFRGIIASSISKSLDELVGVIADFSNKRDEIALSDLFFRFTLDSFCCMAFGTDPGALKATLKDEQVPFASAFDYAQLIMSRRFTNPIWPITERLNGTHSLMKKAAKTIDEYAFGLIDQREKELAAKASGSESGNGEENREDLLSLYMEIKDDSGKGLTRKALRDATLSLLLAGRDTTAQALAWTVFHLLSQPHHIAVIVEEAERVTNVRRELEYGRLKDMHYTTAVFMEGLRLHPSVPANVWEAIEDNQIPNGPRIQKGDKVTWCDWAMARDPAVWGPDAGEFKPQRWLDSEGKFHKQSQWKAHMFNGGNRLCLGQTLATFEGVSVLARLFASFDLSFASDYLATTPMVKTEWCGSETPLYANSLTLPMAQPLRVKASARKAERN